MRGKNGSIFRQLTIPNIPGLPGGVWVEGEVVTVSPGDTLGLTPLTGVSPHLTSVVHSHWYRSLEALLSLVEIMVLLRQLSYAIKTQLKLPKATLMPYALSCVLMA